MKKPRNCKRRAFCCGAGPLSVLAEPCEFHSTEHADEEKHAADVECPTRKAERGKNVNKASNDDREASPLQNAGENLPRPFCFHTYGLH
ncbi:MAG: hypothetical protein A3A96_03800 [Candidatus Zambryskibacteria bacterium RIFCSPLOWO2_01_FULL_39_39]|uniref:Secreted protein n=1 Tax=Candidatus Zambryskibacteria bacterium RIFCSPLOWO2_01_FULL_39_39 TaxID=1802758 RepID=A0A1G2TZ11_9BACT|nr:MAG: hypothetical protein A2644_03385 [Candidatus Zambryskibacteria bacterium RIFCSPHIGHO2_01_FULL_39_63]OHA94614.1 MAG: hypothetical protein A3B88_00190 [Candidatus Zambryskibacteria bacterium RIFCSPHIGHO2_02_FULL_39_19]OHA98065.1 MAG: hypothetical protein A3F20_01090 [Candidatus Zambryskibacteria bacterium RIFCSPHIGHO2_12_FULL_39_21]OHB02528.1 MAG: hypothetical protein A3A96_03800 [Candidatus Zambryskibacteria bacterium RIFCSPLOWO2_01_FULL_39_39]